MKTHQNLNKPSTLQALLTLVIPLLLLAVACDLPFGSTPSLQETQAALGVQSTFDAERAATLNAQQTAIAAQPTQAPPADSTVQAQQATLSAQQTTIAQQSTQMAQQTAEEPTPEPTLESSPTAEPAASLEPILITEWKMSAWVTINSGCKFPDMVCWKMMDAKNEDAYLTSKEGVYIDPTWPNPYLVFWNMRDLRNNADLSILSSTGLGGMVNYSSSSVNWKQETINISQYKGQTITLQFYASVWYYYNEWLIQEVQIVPDFTSR
ncbi:MAG: hypothetical protein JXB15_12005 [Anaerolineales bacterium]|nr:hypothetical protein [Anaerolineales bacterium]